MGSFIKFLSRLFLKYKLLIFCLTHGVKPYFRSGQKYKCLITYNGMISIGKNLTILESVDSTNNYAMAAVRAGLAKHGDAFFAMDQVKGKGQRGKGWMTEPGANIIMSVVLHPSTVQLQQQFRLSMAVALAVHDFFGRYGGDETKIKWPNDIYWRDRKAGGVLIESLVGSQESGVGDRQSSVFSRESVVNNDSRLPTPDFRLEIRNSRHRHQHQSNTIPG